MKPVILDIIVNQLSSEELKHDFVRIYTTGGQYLIPLKNFLESRKVGGEVLSFKHECNHVDYYTYIPMESISSIEFGKNLYHNAKD